MIKQTNIDEFEKDCEAIKTLTREKNPDAIIDGIINTEKYFNIPTDKPRILWILKEANTQVPGWEYQNLLSTTQLAYTRNFNLQSIKRVLYTSYSILNEFIKYEEIPSVSNEEVYGIAENIAYINVNKDPGGKATVDKKLFPRNLEKYREVVRGQIEVYNPDIIILGNTKDFLDQSLFDENIKTHSDIETHNTALYEYTDKLIIYAYHPGAMPKTIKEDVYCNEIIEASKNWWLKKVQNISKI